jgi:hypothetical protein
VVLSEDLGQGHRRRAGRVARRGLLHAQKTTDPAHTAVHAATPDREDEAGVWLPVSTVCIAPHQHSKRTSRPWLVLSMDRSWLGTISCVRPHEVQWWENTVDLPCDVVVFW